ncbi:MAG: hypothetical protein HQK76_05980 [Desulfobacterales bacterium]|nr:hypothetical protein [Desulfobacterales bacterium]
MIFFYFYNNSKLSGIEPVTIQQALIAKHLPIFLKENNISKETFHTAMNEQLLKLVNLSVSGEIISQQQGEELITHINQCNEVIETESNE